MGTAGRRGVKGVEGLQRRGDGKLGHRGRGFHGGTRQGAALRAARRLHHDPGAWDFEKLSGLKLPKQSIG